jgi:cytochrome c oxidase subunit 2
VETAWTTVPFLIVVVLALATARVIHEVQDAPIPPAALDVNVIGHQWWWEIHYPEAGHHDGERIACAVSAVTAIELQFGGRGAQLWVPRLAVRPTSFRIV